ncbi:MAG: CinA family nicotinamide mononucleotide deamidase-related protein [Flavobacteriales bacterium]|jgi:nicotinamide-nucleotide amidase|nr:CinA family nicotinamide mononucleotide deamidase-related protein [Flavobacteriales bacterium]
MRADIITIGDEILIGQTIDTNSAWIGDFLESNGIQVVEISTISDKQEHIVSALNNSLKHSDFIFLTGGLGPTKDDITKQTLCDFFGDKLVLSQEVLKDIKAYFELRNRMVNEYTELQALVPSKCKVIRNRKGTAPGMWFEHNGKVIVSMPGVPYEMKSMMQLVLFKLKEAYSLLEIVHKTVYTRGIIESHLAELIVDWENSLPKEIKLAYLPSASCLMLRFTARGNDRAYIENLIDENIETLKTIIGPYFSKYQKRLNEEVVGQIMNEKDCSISTAESCTGGNIAKMITSISGSSEYFKGSLVAYSKKIKEDVLKVSSDTISAYGLVSEEVVREMAQCSQRLFNSDFAISTSGLAELVDSAGVKGGTICMAVATPLNVYSQTVAYNTDRDTNIIRASNAALNFLISVAEK